MMTGVLCIQSIAASWRWVTKYTVRYGFLKGQYLMANVVQELELWCELFHYDDGCSLYSINGGIMALGN